MNTFLSAAVAAAAGALASAGVHAQGVSLRPLTGVNTAADETAPRPAGEALTFTRTGGHAIAFAPGFRWLGFASADAGEGAPATPTLSASIELNGRSPVSSSSSARGEGIAVAREHVTAAGRTVREIALSRRGSLDYLEAYDFPYNDERFNSTDPALHADGRRMIFASDRPGGYGGYDLYYTEYGADGWSAPVNLGPDVNSGSDELACFWGPDGLIAFASNRPGGLGGLDLYTLDASAPVWRAPRHLGLPFSTESDDTYFAYDRQTRRGVLASNRPGGRGGFDVYAFDLPAEGARGLAWLPAYAPTTGQALYSARDEAIAGAEATLRHLRRTGSRDDVEVAFDLSTDRGVATALAHDLALSYERLAAAADDSSFRLATATLQLTAGLTGEMSGRMLEDCEAAVAGLDGPAPLVLTEATAPGTDAEPGGTLRVRMTFSYDDLDDGVTASAAGESGTD